MENKIAKEDIISYNYLLHNTKKNTFLTSSKYVEIILGETYTKYGFKDDYFEMIETLTSYVQLDDAIKGAKQWVYPSGELKLIKCIIPKGTEYCTHIDEKFSPYQHYVSDKLKYVEIINTVNDNLYKNKKSGKLYDGNCNSFDETKMELVHQIRKQRNYGICDIKIALLKSDYDVEKAFELLSKNKYKVATK